MRNTSAGDADFYSRDFQIYHENLPGMHAMDQAATEQLVSIRAVVPPVDQAPVVQEGKTRH
jgi:hypothetical protein